MKSPPSRKRIDREALSSNMDSVSAIDLVARPIARLAGVALADLLTFLVTVVLTIFIVVCLGSAGGLAMDAKKPMIFFFGKIRWQINLAQETN